LPGLLAPDVYEIHGRFALLSVRSFAPSEASEVRAHPARLRGPLLRPLLTPRSAFRRRPFRREARPPQVRVVAFAARSPRLRRPPLVARVLRSFARSPWLAAPHTRFLSVNLQLLLFASFSLGLAACALRFARGSCDQAPQRTCTSWSRPCWAHKAKRPRKGPLHSDHPALRWRRDGLQCPASPVGVVAGAVVAAGGVVVVTAASGRIDCSRHCRLVVTPALSASLLKRISWAHPFAFWSM
jgi:hypothetical protein